MVGFRSTAAGGAQSVEKICLESAKQVTGVETGDSASQAKVFKAHAVPQGVCVKT